MLHPVSFSTIKFNIKYYLPARKFCVFLTVSRASNPNLKNRNLSSIPEPVCAPYRCEKHNFDTDKN